MKMVEADLTHFENGEGREKPVSLFLLCAAMELCYLYAATNLVTTSVLHQAFPFPEAIGSFLLAALLMSFSAGRGWRVIYILGFQSLGFVPALLRVVGIFRGWSDSFLQQSWLTDFFDTPTGAIEYFVFVLVVVWILVFWAGGVELARRPLDYAALVARFDRGLVVFFILFLTKFYLQVVQGIRLDENISGFLLIPFMIFGLLAIGWARNRSAAQKDFLPGYRAIGAMLGFIVVALLVGVGLAFFFLPYLTAAAERGNDILQIVTGPLLSVLFLILNWLFGDAFSRPGDLPTPQNQPPVVSSQWNFPGWVEVVGKILTASVVIVVVLVMLAVLGGLLYSILRWLFSPTSRDAEKPSLRHLFLSFLTGLGALCVAFWLGLVRNARGYRRAAQFYAALRTWGRHSGMPHGLDETPREYGRRLARRFPALARELELIVEEFNREVYGETMLNPQQLAAAHSAWRRIASPVHWLMRLKA